MKIAIICDPVDLDKKTWISVYSEQLVIRLKEDANNEYVFFHLKQNPLFEWSEEVVYESPTFLPILFQLWVAWKKFVLIPIELRRRKIDLVHDLNTIGPQTFDFFRNYKTVSTIFDITPVLYKKYHSFINVFAFNLFVGRALRSSDAIIAISEATKSDVASYYDIPTDKIYVTLLWSKTKLPDTEPPKAFDFPYILSVWTLEPRKNLKWLIQAFFLLKKNWAHPDVKLVLTGKIGWKIDSLLREYWLSEGWFANDVVLTGFLPDDELVWLYRHCSCFAYVSFYEWFWLPVLEAMSLWAPVITSNCSSIPEVAWDACVLVDPSNPADIASALDNVLIDVSLRQRLSAAWIERSKLFSWERCTTETLDVYRRIERMKNAP